MATELGVDRCLQKTEHVVYKKLSHTCSVVPTADSVANASSSSARPAFADARYTSLASDASSPILPEAVFRTNRDSGSSDSDFDVGGDPPEQFPRGHPLGPESTASARQHTSNLGIPPAGAGAADDGDIRQWWRAERIKQDILHIFLRFQRVLSKEHGAFKIFMSRLRDTFFIPSPEDLEFLRVAMRAAGWTDAKIDEKMKTDYNYFMERVRRHVPSPAELERKFNKVVFTFAYLKDSKTDRLFFGTKAWNLYKTTLQHIKKGCLSDIPGMSYYIVTGYDQHGVPKVRCVRGTSALEGFHQKIRQVLRGFFVSPRYALALLHEFVYRWNIDIDINVCGLPEKYRVFESFRFEDEQDATRSWGLVPTAFHELLSTREVADTGEWFGMVQQPRHPSHIESESKDNSDCEIEVEGDAAAVASELEGNENSFASAGDSREHQLTESHKLPASSRWMARQLNTSRPFGPVATPTEKTFFESNYLNYQASRVGRDADNRSFIDWSLFQIFWCECIAAEENGKRARTDMTNKTSGDLARYYKLYSRANNARLTLEPIQQEQQELRTCLRSTDRSSDVIFEEAQHRPPRGSTQATNGAFSGDRVLVPTFVHRSHASAFSVPLARSGSVPALGESDPSQAGLSSSRPQKRDRRGVRKTELTPRQARRCRMCGKECDHEQWAPFHVMDVPDHSGRALCRGQLLQPHAVCTVPIAQREDGFPVPDGKRIRRRSRQKHKSAAVGADVT